MSNQILVPAYPTTRSREPAEIFRAGVYPDGVYDREFLSAVVRNWEKYQKPQDPRFPLPPAVLIPVPPPRIGIGHDEDQEYLRSLIQRMLDRTDLPAAGWPSNLRLVGDVLYADFEGVPLEVASRIQAGLLPCCSAEFYPDYVDATGTHYGPTLRRVSLLGAEIPRVKGLARNPVMVFSDGQHQQTVCYFSERFNSMDRNTLIAALGAMGMDTTAITDAIPDALLQSMYDTCMKGQGGDVMPPAPAPTGTDLPQEMPQTPAQFSEMVGKLVTKAVQPLLVRIHSQQAELSRLNGDKDRNEVVAFCERMTREGKITPAQMAADGGAPSIVDTLMSLDGLSPVVKFGERTITPRAAMMAQIERSAPVRRFAEKMQVDSGGRSGRMSPTQVHEAMSSTPLGRAILAKQTASKN